MEQHRNPRPTAGQVTRRRRRLALSGGVLLGLPLVALFVLDLLLPLPPVGAAGARVVVASDGTPLHNYPSEDGVWRYPVAPDDVSPRYVQTLLAYEDRWFYWHPGINPWAMLRAGWQWARHGRIVSGGSTLTMQVARMLDPALAGQPSRSLAAKGRQVWRAVQLEMHYSKDEILGMYLAHAPMGGIVEGVEMGARLWLGKSARDLSDAEAALLTALPQAPSRLRPDRHPERAQAARDKVMSRMQAAGLWSVARVADARIENVVAPPLRARWLAPLAAQRLLQGQARGQPVVASTLDADMQTTVERMLLDRVDSLPPKVSMAVLVMDNDSLDVKAYAGSADFSDDSRYAHVDMVRAIRSPGSTLKPFLYAQALDDGLVHSESLLMDVPMSFGGYAPGNFQASFSGPVSVSQALQRSLNVPAVDLLDRVGPMRFASAMLNAGVHLRMPAGAAPNLSLILGGGGTSLQELVGAYRALAREGLAGQPRLRPDEPRRESRAMSAGAAWIVRDILEGGGHPDRSFFQSASPGWALAWKTGTSFGFRDAWAIGVTDGWTIGVWVGRPDGTPNPGFFGANIAAPLLQDVVAALPAGAPRVRVRPASVTAVVSCWPVGWRREHAPEGVCPQQRAAWALNDTVPPSFTEYASLAGGPIRIEGVAQGAVLRPVPGTHEVILDLALSGAEGQVWWMLDGKLYRQAGAAERQGLSLKRNGRYHLTVMDDAGRYTDLEFEIAGVTP
ncbi:penicillin-binding protein 1C [Bordetella holmesii]|uniref:penicillin-binding protein 1C n=1 Tax=Bordetella holmesii TaxID=35814 RepID=UPI000C77CAB2|nr:penicillin-binding protein 1C [Bordetella holmesii]